MFMQVLLDQTFLQCAVALCLFHWDLFLQILQVSLSAVSSQAQSTQYMCYMHIAVIVSDVFNLHISTMNIHSMNKCKPLHVFLDSR